MNPMVQSVKNSPNKNKSKKMGPISLTGNPTKKTHTHPTHPQRPPATVRAIHHYWDPLQSSDGNNLQPEKRNGGTMELGPNNPQKWHPSAKRTASSHLKIDGWKTFSFPFWVSFLAGAFAVSFRECI